LLISIFFSMAFPLLWRSRAGSGPYCSLAPLSGNLRPFCDLYQ
jgi:hypothetical protein